MYTGDDRRGALRPHVSRREFLALSATALAAFGLAGCGAKGAPADAAATTGVPAHDFTEGAQGLNEAKTITIGFQGASANAYLEKHFHYHQQEFEKDGITVNFQQFTSGPPLIEAMAGGKVDFGEVGDMPPVNARSNGIDVKIISKSLVVPGSNTLEVPTNSTLASVADLKGQKVGTNVGSSSHHFLAALLAKNGLSIKDVELVNIKPADGGNALETGQIAGYTTWEPWGSQIVNRGQGKLYADDQGVKQNTETFIVRNEFGTKNPLLTARFLKVWRRYAAYVEANRDEALQIVAEQSQFDPNDIRKMITAAKTDTDFTDYDYQQMEATKQFLLDNKTLKRDYDINELYDFSYLEKAKELG